MQMLNFTNNCYLKEENKIHMTKNAIFWIREDFRIERNPALSFASQNHDNVIGLFIYNKDDFLLKIATQITLLSAHVINKSLISEKDANEYCGSNFRSI